jgi:hypothetical protein
MTKTTTEQAMSQTEIESLYNSLQSLGTQFAQFAKAQDELIYKVSGNPLDKDDRGMIGEMKELRTDLDIVMEDRKRIKWMLGSAIAIGTPFLDSWN